jgi:hypothetical protein
MSGGPQRTSGDLRGWEGAKAARERWRACVGEQVVVASNEAEEAWCNACGVMNGREEATTGR